MRFAFRIDLNGIAPCAALCTAIALLVPPVGVHAQETLQAQSAMLAEAGEAGSATVPGTTLATAASFDQTLHSSALFHPLDANVPAIPADGASVNDFSLDDQMLSRQRGGAVGMVMVAATPQLMHGSGGGNGVTLWDEIAPPSPLPVPVDAARSAQGNVANYQRK
ncbi:hypothetical protein A6V36_03840 [Paraburkholderia ginsengiterrae]|uniref:Uncharacterized protein n=1 Tax=Paraburkholderia ginsengiterrae TaxID=1462993 RepID=A0A1A9N6N0_9BURK|nr:hypothetical protein [Paraburkholderia ginsengiterrae]OAJ57626.1 hypothetical protein A6V37_05305 [Paraburkholderia ginsengiterrae]OAJ58080.1 hypothetical protein A6V36_03840 [Paraburkholderia ginsengiterrae]